MDLITDESTKDVIAGVTENYEKLFEALSPSLFRYNNEPSDTRIHVGLIAEDFLYEIKPFGFDKNNFCFYVKDK